MATPKTKLFVGHLPDLCSDEDLRALFEKYGVVTECDVINKYGFVHMATPEQANEAVKHLNNYNLLGSTISVEPSRSKLHPEPGAPGRANKQSVVNRRGGLSPRNGYALPPPRGGYGGGFSNGYNRRYDIPPLGSDSFYDRSFAFGRDRMRPYPPPFERRSPTMPPLRDDYPRRPLPPLTSDPYSRPLPPLAMRDELYERRPLPERSDYLYSRRSPPLSSMRSPYAYDSIFNGNARAPPPSATRRLSYF